MLIKGSFPPLLATITDADKWPMVARDYPRIWQLLPLLRSLAEKAFERTFESDHIQSFGVYGLGRQCLEDFLEILTLTESQLHVGAQKLLRGLFERLVVADVIADDRQEAEKFSNFHHINVRKVSNRAESAYQNPNCFADVEDSEAYIRVKDAFGNRGWSTKNLKQQTEEVLAKAGARMGLSTAEAKKQADALYLGGADLSNFLIHASMTSIHARVKDLSNETIVFKDSFDDHFALPMAISYLVLVLETQGRFFALGLDSETEQLSEQVHTALSEEYDWPEADAELRD